MIDVYKSYKLFILFAIYIFVLLFVSIVAKSSDVIDTVNVVNEQEVVDEALMQCYALEGSYPYDIEYLEKYGVELDYQKYNYYYELSTAYRKPTLVVTEKN